MGYDVKREGRRKDKLIFADRELFVYSLLFHAYLTSDVAIKVFVHPSIYCVYTKHSFVRLKSIINLSMERKRERDSIYQRIQFQEGNVMKY